MPGHSSFKTVYRLIMLKNNKDTMTGFLILTEYFTGSLPKYYYIPVITISLHFKSTIT